MMSWLRKVEHELKQTVMRPGTQLTRGQKFLRLCIDLARHARRELRDHSAPTMAAALTYRTIFGFVPMLVMALIVFRAFGGFADSQDGLRNVVYDLLEVQVQALEESADPPEEEDGSAAAPEEPPRSYFLRKIDRTLEVNTPQVDPNADEDIQREQANAEMRQRIDQLLGGLSEGASSISIGSIGVIGMLVLIWAALGLVVTVERTFNVVYNAPSGHLEGLLKNGQQRQSMDQEFESRPKV